MFIMYTYMYIHVNDDTLDINKKKWNKQDVREVPNNKKYLEFIQ